MYVFETLTVMLAILNCVSMVFWAANYNAVRALLLYMHKNGYKIPTSKEIKSYSIYVAKNSLGIQTEDMD